MQPLNLPLEFLEASGGGWVCDQRCAHDMSECLFVWDISCIRLKNTKEIDNLLDNKAKRTTCIHFLQYRHHFFVTYNNEGEIFFSQTWFIAWNWLMMTNMQQCNPHVSFWLPFKEKHTKWKGLMHTHAQKDLTTPWHHHVLPWWQAVSESCHGQTVHHCKST